MIKQKSSRIRAAGDDYLKLVRRLPLLGRLRRQLQHHGALARNEIVQQHDRAIGEFERVVMLVGLIEVDLAKPGQ